MLHNVTNLTERRNKSPLTTGANKMRQSSRKNKNPKVYTKYYAFNKLGETTNHKKSFNVMESVLIENKFTKKTFDQNIKSKMGEIDFNKKTKGMEKQIIKFHELMKSVDDYNIWFRNASTSDEILRRKTPRTESGKFDKYFIKAVERYKNKINVNKGKNDFKKQDKEFLKEENNLNVLKKLMIECLRKVQKDTGKYTEANLSKLRVAFTIRNKNVLGTHYSKAWDKGNFDDKQGNQVEHIVIRKNVLYDDKKTILYNPTSFEDTSAVAIHELGHLLINNSGNHGEAFEECMIDFKQEIKSGKGTRKCHTYHTKEFKKYFSEIFKRLSKEWNAQEGMHTNITEKTKTITLKCGTCGSRVSIANQSKKHSLVNFYCDHNGTDWENESETVMEQHETKKPNLFLDGDNCTMPTETEESETTSEKVERRIGKSNYHHGTCFERDFLEEERLSNEEYCRNFRK